MGNARSSNHGTFYQITVRGRLDPSWSDWFNGMTVDAQPGLDGSTETSLTGRVADQAALQGLLMRISDLGLVLLEVKRVPSPAPRGKEVPSNKQMSVSS
jgi:hypothetical protein